jgi:hypothetical protein
MPTKYRVLVRRFDGTDETVISTGLSERDAERTERGVLVNLNTDEWFVTTEEES